MQTDLKTKKSINTLLEKDKRYSYQAYYFILESVNYSINKNFTRDQLESSEPNHISGQELSFGIKDYAIEKYGPFAIIVLKYWGITDTMDFGNIVYNLIDIGLLRKSKSDTLECFNNVFDFHEEMVEKYKFKKIN